MISILGSIKILKPTPNYFLISYGVYNYKIYPCVIIKIRSAKLSASSKCCELIMIDLSFLMSFISCQTYSLDSTSRPEVGSSKISSFGWETIAIANDNFLFMPPDNSEVILSLCSNSITDFNVLSIIVEI